MVHTFYPDQDPIQTNMKILGISAFYHDSAAALIKDGQVLAAAQEERFTRKKHTAEFPAHALRYCLDHSGYGITDLDAIVFYDKPLLKFERLLETYHHFAPRGISSFMAAMPVWLKEKLFLKRIIRQELKPLGHDAAKSRLLFPEHHLSHCASAFYPSPFQDAAILTIDGVGEWATSTIAYGDRETITIHKELHFPHSLGLLYSAFTYYLGFTVNSGEYKLMGLAPYGNPASSDSERFIRIIRERLIDIKDDGSLWLNQHYFRYATGLRMVYEKKWLDLFGFPARKPEGAVEQHHCDLAHAIQTVTEEVVLKMAAEAKRLTAAKHLCLAGGVALNCVANGKLLQQNLFDDLFIQPAAGDAGGALGAALAAYYIYFGQKRTPASTPDAMQGAYLGPAYAAADIERMARKQQAVYHTFAGQEALLDKTAELLAQGNVIGWMQGRMEFGPRALGNRSILGDARNPDMQKRLNLKIKYREGFRPFAPAVLAEECRDYFELATASPYMLLIAPVAGHRRRPLPEDYYEMPLWDRLYYQRSDIPAVTHLDFSARVQTVHQQTNPLFWNLLQRFKAHTGYSLLVNTSFNVRGEPIVCTPADAYQCFMATDMDYLVIGDYLFVKTEQPDWQNREKWQHNYKPD